MIVSRCYELKRSEPGKCGERIVTGLTDDSSKVAIRFENDEGDAVELHLTREQSMAIAGTIQGTAFQCR